MENKKYKTYVELKSEKPFDWYSFLTKEYYDVNKRHDAYELAKNWVTCAVGNQCVIIPRREDGKPLDHMLADLGIKFATHIGEMVNTDKMVSIYDARTKALKTLEEIEKRSQYIIDWCNQIKNHFNL